MIETHRLKSFVTFYILRHSLFLICLILLFNKTKQAKETRMSYNNKKKHHFFFSINISKIQDSTWNSFLRWYLSYFALENIRLHRNDSFFRIILLLLGDINVSPGPTTVTNSNIPLNTLPHHNHGDSTMPSEH